MLINVSQSMEELSSLCRKLKILVAISQSIKDNVNLCPNSHFMFQRVKKEFSLFFIDWLRMCYIPASVVRNHDHWSLEKREKLMRSSTLR